MLLQTYPPLNTLKPIADDVWIVDGPLIRFGVAFIKMPFPTRMTIIRLPGRKLFVHSPTVLTPDLMAEVLTVGEPFWIVGPNRIHYWWIPEWHRSFPEAAVYLAPRIAEQACGHIDFSDWLMLDREEGYPWDGALATLPVAGDFMTEVEFFHHESRTLLLTDFIENFEPGKLNLFERWLTWLGGVQDPDGQMPHDMRLTFRRQKPQLRAAVQKMIAWNPQRIVLAHGRWYDGDGAIELRRSFRWAID